MGLCCVWGVFHVSGYHCEQVLTRLFLGLQHVLVDCIVMHGSSVKHVRQAVLQTRACSLHHANLFIL